MRLMIIALIGLALLLQYEFWFGRGSVLTAWRLKTKVAMQSDKNRALKQRNDAVEADIQDLKKGNRAVEERARSELGMVKKGEVFYQVVKKRGSMH